MLYSVCKYIKNFFVSSIKSGVYTIEDGTIDLPLIDGQYFLIEGSVLNDGVYQYPVTGLRDEAFNGTIVGMSIPQEFLDLVKEIEAYNEKSSQDSGLYVSESFGGYSYTKATDSNGNVASWKSAFANRLNLWRKL